MQEMMQKEDNEFISEILQNETLPQVEQTQDEFKNKNLKQDGKEGIVVVSWK